MKSNLQSAEFRQLLDSHLTMLKPHQGIYGVFNAEVSVRGYSDIAFYVADLLKVAIMALDSDSIHGASPTIPQPNLNIVGVLELALGLLPFREFELLDILRRDWIETEVLPEYCYSSVKVVG